MSSKKLATILAILALITSGNNYVGLGSRRGGATPHRLDSNGRGGGEVYSGTHFISSTLFPPTHPSEWRARTQEGGRR